MPNDLRPLDDDGELVALRRSDLAALAHAYQSALSRPGMWMNVVLGIGSLALAVVLINVAESRHWPAVLSPVFLAGGWAVMLGAFVNVTVRSRRVRARYAFRCPACNEYLLGGPRAPVGTPRADMAVATGNCPSCGAHILEPD